LIGPTSKTPQLILPNALRLNKKEQKCAQGEMVSSVLPATNNVEHSTASRNSVTSAPTGDLPGSIDGTSLDAATLTGGPEIILRGD